MRLDQLLTRCGASSGDVPPPTLDDTAVVTGFGSHFLEARGRGGAATERRALAGGIAVTSPEAAVDGIRNAGRPCDLLLVVELLVANGLGVRLQLPLIGRRSLLRGELLLLLRAGDLVLRSLKVVDLLLLLSKLLPYSALSAANFASASALVIFGRCEELPDAASTAEFSEDVDAAFACWRSPEGSLALDDQSCPRSPDHLTMTTEALCRVGYSVA